VTCIAAVGDVHVGMEGADALAAGWEGIGERARALLLAGDLTRCGDPGEAKLLAEVLERVPVPVVAVLGNHDHHADQPEELTGVLEDVGVTVLEGTSTVLDLDGTTLGIAGTKGFGGGFAGATISEFGEPEMKSFARHGICLADRLESALRDIADADHRVALLHYSPLRGTLRGEHPEIYPALGSYLFGEAVDRAGADLVIHGHAHRGTERGLTPGGIRVRNVAQPVIDAAYRLYDLSEGHCTSTG
jgi:Icc-related predicted phosphoesterase